MSTPEKDLARLMPERDETRAALTDLESRPGDWLHDAAGRMTEAAAADWNQWRKG